MEDFKNELCSLLTKVISVGVFLLLYFILYRYFYKNIVTIFSRLGLLYEDDVKHTFGVFAFNCFLITIGVSASLTFIAAIILFWYYVVGVISFLFLIVFDKNVKYIYYIKGLFMVIIILFLLKTYQYRNFFLHG
jgi:hypothetical protein